MRLIVVTILISFSFSILIRHPNSMKKTIDYTKSGTNWLGTCKSGAKQSPISIDKYNKIDKNIIHLKYGHSLGHLKWNGSFFEIKIKDKNSKVKFTNNKKKPAKQILYILKKVLFKTPQEHFIEGKHNELEMQFIHETSDKNEHHNVLIISVFGKVTSNKNN